MGGEQERTIMPNENIKETEIKIVRKVNRIPKDKIAVSALLIYTLLCSIAIGVCFIVNFAHDKGITWSAFVLGSVGYAWLTALPLFLAKKHKAFFSLAILPVTTIPFLYLLDQLTPPRSWFAPLALPIAASVILGIWICAAIVRFVKVNKWYLSAALVALFGTFTSLIVTSLVSQFLGEAVSPLNNIITIFSLVMVSAFLSVIGYIQSIVTKYNTKESERDRQSGGTIWHSEKHKEGSQN